MHKNVESALLGAAIGQRNGRGQEQQQTTGKRTQPLVAVGTSLQ